MLKNIFIAISLIILEWRVKRVLKNNLKNIAHFTYIPNEEVWKNYISYSNPKTLVKYNWQLHSKTQQFGHFFPEPPIVKFCDDLEISLNLWWKMTEEMSDIVEQHENLFFHSYAKPKSV